MSQRRERIPAKDVKESKNWSLPYWTESGDVVQKEDDNHENDPDVWVEDEEEMEIEPLTAEALEKIRQEAYNDGLEQGLIEGRQKGEQKGFDEGYQDGQRKGLEEGKSQGYKDGLATGNKEAAESLEKQRKAFKQASQHVFKNLDDAFQVFKKETEETLPELVEMLATGVVGAELEQGSEHIVRLVKQALDAIPVDKKQITILVNEADLPFLEAGLEQDYQIVSDDRIEPGGCQLQSKQSSADFSLSKRLQQILSDYRKQVQLGSQTLEEENEDSIVDGVDLEAEPSEDEDGSETPSRTESVETESAEAESAEAESGETESSEIESHEKDSNEDKMVEKDTDQTESVNEQDLSSQSDSEQTHNQQANNDDFDHEPENESLNDSDSVTDDDDPDGDTNG